MNTVETVKAAILMVVTNEEREVNYMFHFEDAERLEIVAEGDRVAMDAAAKVLNERNYFAGKWHYYFVHPANWARAKVAKH